MLSPTRSFRSSGGAITIHHSRPFIHCCFPFPSSAWCVCLASLRLAVSALFSAFFSSFCPCFFSSFCPCSRPSFRLFALSSFAPSFRLFAKDLHSRLLWASPGPAGNFLEGVGNIFDQLGPGCPGRGLVGKEAEGKENWHRWHRLERVTRVVLWICPLGGVLWPEAIFRPRGARFSVTGCRRCLAAQRRQSFQRYM